MRPRSFLQPLRPYLRCVAGLLLTAIVGCAPREPVFSGFTIGAVIDRSGSNAEPSWSDAIALAEKQFNTALVATGHSDVSFRVLIDDSRNDPETAIALSTKLVAQGAKALIIDSSQNAQAVNALHYDADPSNDPRVPLQCSGCTSSSINNPAAQSSDPVLQKALRNEQKWMFRTIMSTKLSAVLINRELLKLGTPAADVNGDGKVKIAIYNTDEIFGNGAANDVINFGQQMQDNPPLLYEQHKFPANADPDGYLWADDLNLLTNNINEATQSIDAYPDYVVVVTFGHYYIPIIKTWAISEYNKKVPEMVSFHNLRIQSALNSLGSFGNGQNGISHVLIEDNPSGIMFLSDYQIAYNRLPVYRDSHYYDNAITLMLATWRAAHNLPNPLAVTGEEVRQALVGIADVAAPVVRTGSSELIRAIGAIDRGETVNYEGASGPLDYDESQNVKNRMAHFRIDSQQTTDVAAYDCVQASGTSNLAALHAACPIIPR